MIFVGSLDKGYFAEEVCNKFNLSFDYVQEAAHISEQVNEILSYQKQDYTIFDVEQYIDEAEDVVDGIIKICNANNSKPIIFAAGYMNNSNIIVSAANKGITYFVTAVMLSDMKDQLEKCLNGYYDANGISEVEELQKLEIVRPLLLPELVEESEQLQWQYRLFDIFRCREKQLVIFR